MNYNSCLYKKIGIDVDGFIKNCPSTKKIISHVNNINTLKINELETELWYLKKDDISICSDCEFRYICNDCRVKTMNGIKSRPTTCEYNPYTSQWEDNDNYKNFDECGVIFKNEELKINHEKIAKINQELWGEEE